MARGAACQVFRRGVGALLIAGGLGLLFIRWRGRAMIMSPAAGGEG